MKMFFMKKIFIKRQMLIYSLILLLLICQAIFCPISIKAGETTIQTEQEENGLDFQLSIDMEIGTKFLMGEVILPYELAENEKIKADVYFSTDGEAFTLLDGNFHDWCEWGGKTKRKCMYPTLSPLKEYLAGEII